MGSNNSQADSKKTESNFNLDDFDFDFYQSSAISLSGRSDDLSLFMNNQFLNFDADQPLQELGESDDYNQGSKAESIPLTLSATNSNKSSNQEFNSEMNEYLSKERPSFSSYTTSTAPLSPYSTTSYEYTPQDFENNELEIDSSTDKNDDSHKDGNSGIEIPHTEKRRRNTIASARFRIKKKQKEKEMEMRFRNIHEHIANLKVRVKTLEMENKCLKELLLNNSGQRTTVGGTVVGSSTSNYELLKILKKHSGDSFKITSV